MGNGVPIIGKGGKDPELGYNTLEVLKQHGRMLRIHYNTIGCHCECMGMMCENILHEDSPEFGYQDFKVAMIKWGLTDEKGEPIL